MKLDPVSLRLFVSVVEEGSLARAAERGHLAAAAVSRRLSELERTLGTKVLRRTNKGMEPTTAGAALLDLAREALNSLDEIYVQMRDYGSGLRKQVRVLASLPAITQFLPGEMAPFLAAHPDVQIDLEESSSSLIVKAVAKNAADFGVCVAFPHGEDLEVFQYRRDRLALIVPGEHVLARRHSVSFLETLDFRYIGFLGGSAINLQLAKVAAELKRTLKLTTRVAGYESLCQMVHSGFGIGVLPEVVADRYAKTLGIRVVRLEEPWAGRELKIYVRRYAALSVPARLLVDHLKGGSSPLRALAIAFRDRDLARQDS